jgi:hypothetical protein
VIENGKVLVQLLGNIGSALLEFLLLPGEFLQLFGLPTDLFFLLPKLLKLILRLLILIIEISRVGGNRLEMMRIKLDLEVVSALLVKKHGLDFSYSGHGYAVVVARKLVNNH